MGSMRGSEMNTNLTNQKVAKDTGKKLVPVNRRKEMNTIRKPITKSILAGLLLLVLALSACIPANPLPDTGGSEAQAVQTQVAQLVSAQQTQAAGATAVARLTQMANNPPKNEAPVQQPTATATPTTTPVQTEEPVTEPT